MIETHKDPLRSGSPRALLTSFGWCVVGPVTGERGTEKIGCNTITVKDPAVIFTHLVEDFFLNNTFGTKPDIKLPVGAEEQRAVPILEETTKFVDGHFEVGLLRRSDGAHVPNNFPAALRRFYSTERTLLSNQELCKMYVAGLQEYVSLGHAHKLTAEKAAMETPGWTWYIPHHPVLNPNKPGKCRIVFDASAEYRGVSLNSQLLKGPDLLSNMVGVLIRFRQFPVAVSADIVKIRVE